MSRSDELVVTVLDVACLTEDRTPAEQRAMLAVALRLDKERGLFSGTNPKPLMPCLVAHVRLTYNPSEGKRVDLSPAERRQHETLLAKWEACESCGEPVGAHPAQGCPRSAG